MNNAKHTPGPWTCDGGRYLPIIAIVDGKPAQIGRAESCGQIGDEEVEANGALIAAAPDLLKALKTVVRQMEGRHPVGHDAFLAARRAIAKAEPAD